MLERLTTLYGLELEARDGDLGSVDDLRFDSIRWTIRYLVVNPGSWIGRRVAISPISVGRPDWTTERLEVRLTRDQIRNSPDLLALEPINLESERSYAAYYGYPAYWGGPDLWGWAGYPGALAAPPPAGYASTEAQSTRGSCGSTRALKGLQVHAADGGIGHIDDGFVDDESWQIRYLLIDTSNWIGGAHVLMPTSLVGAIDWAGQRLAVLPPRDRIETAPRYDGSRPLDRILEEAVGRHYALAGQGVAERPI